MPPIALVLSLRPTDVVLEAHLYERRVMVEVVEPVHDALNYEVGDRPGGQLAGRRVLIVNLDGAFARS